MEANDVLARLVSRDLESELRKARLASSLLQQRMDRTAGDDRDLSSRTTIVEEKRARDEEGSGLKRQLRELVIRAPFAGVLLDVDSELHAGAWVNRSDLLTRIVGGTSAMVRAYGNEDVLWRVDVGETGVFVPDDAQGAVIDVTLREVEQAGADSLSIPYLSSVYGGAVPSEQSEDGKIEPRHSQFVFRLSADMGAPSTVIRGVVRLPGKPQSIVSRIWTRVAQVLVRESGV